MERLSMFLGYNINLHLSWQDSMRTKLLPFAILFIFSSDLYANDATQEVMSNCNYSDNLKDGMCVYYFRNGAIAMKGDYRQGKKIGIWEIYQKEGSISQKGSFRDGLQTGVWKIYYSNGKIKTQGSWSKGLKDGFWEHYNESNKLQMIERFSEGELVVRKIP
jgi:antitoxin component YwqK of YwqJK toxin-antitoxin module